MRYLLVLLIAAYPLAFPTFFAPERVKIAAAEGSEVREPAPRLFEARDLELFQEKQELVQPNAPAAANVLRVATTFLGTPYDNTILDRPATEQLVLNLRRLDCWTFVEYSLAQALAGPEADFDAFARQVQDLRYWGGVVNGYGSRIHYFSGWILQAAQRGILQDMTRELGGIPYRNQVGYISARPARYPKIRDAANLRAVKLAEERINAADWYYIPKNRVRAIEPYLQEGDIIVLTSVKKDLDIAHQGFAVRKNGRIHLMHASSLNKRVAVSSHPLPEYMATQRGQSGIMVIRVPPNVPPNSSSGRK